MSNTAKDGLIDMIHGVVTKRNLGSGNWTRTITRFKILYLFLTNKIDMMRRLSIQFEWRYQVIETHV
jgi:hypothetical protein